MRCDGKIDGGDETVPNEDSQQRLFLDYDMFSRSNILILGLSSLETRCTCNSRKTVLSYVNGASRVSPFSFLFFLLYTNLYM
jgi:hypothetical protein